jgi:Mrp family chromosome partitioning ATPase
MTVEMPPGADRPPLLRGVLRHHWPAVVIAVVVCAALGAAFGLAKGRSYRSTATVLLAPLEGVPYSPESVAKQSQSTTDALTDARLAATPAVARLVERSVGLPPDSLSWRPNLSVDVVPNTQVVKISYLSSSSRRARRMAHAFSTDYLRYRAIRSQASVTAQLHSLEARARQAQRRLTTVTHALASNTNVRRPALNQQVAIYTDQLAAISVQTAQLAGASRDPGQVLTPAGSAVATGVPTAALALIGTIVGLLLGLAFAFVRESGDRRLREATDVEGAGLPLLATLKAPRSAPPEAEEIERYRTLRTAVLTHAPAPRVIAFAALSPAILAADVAAGLGTALARAGSEATVVLATPGPDRSRGARAGLADVLLQDADPRAVRDKVAPGLYLLEAGPEIEVASEMFASEKLRNTLRKLAGESGYVLVAAPVTGTAASTALAAVCDEVILVTPLQDSSLQDLTAAVDEIRQLRGSVLGAVAVERGDGPRAVVSPSLPRIARSSVSRWRATIPRRKNEDADGSAGERRLRALSTAATALEHRIAEASSSAAAEPAPEEELATTTESSSAPEPSTGRKRAGTTKRGRNRNPG